MNAHSAIVVTEDELTLGFMHQESIPRNKRKAARKGQQTGKRPVEDKESCRWMSTMRKVRKRLQEGVNAVVVCDREGDFHELFATAEEVDAKFLTRCVWNRRTDEDRRLLD